MCSLVSVCRPPTVVMRSKLLRIMADVMPKRVGSSGLNMVGGADSRKCGSAIERVQIYRTDPRLRRLKSCATPSCLTWCIPVERRHVHVALRVSNVRSVLGA